MAASCGPHHLVHGWRVLQGDSISYPMFAATLIGLPAGLVFVLLRFETVLGGQVIAGSRSRRTGRCAGRDLHARRGRVSGLDLRAAGADFAFQFLCTSAGLADRIAGVGIDYGSVTFLANMFV